jgi:hypothetical protein
MANIHGTEDVWKNAMERLKTRLDMMLYSLDKLLEVRKKKKPKKELLQRYTQWVNSEIKAINTAIPPNEPIMTVVKKVGVNSLAQLWEDFAAAFKDEKYDNARAHLVNLIEVCSTSI